MRFEDAARAALAEDQGRRRAGVRGLLMALEEALVDRLSPRRRPGALGEVRSRDGAVPARRLTP
jgi:hypothetical protein